VQSAFSWWLKPIPQQKADARGALNQALAQHPTIPPERGIFLPETWRLPPSICAFTSEVFYEGKLHSKSELEQRELRNTELIDGAGLWVLPVTHEGNQNCSPEEVDAIEYLIDRYSLNRMNVATSRAQCACVLVASPRLFAPDCKTPRQMQLANALCRYVEMANSLSTVAV
jgi:superfamily I DNA and/or RNA helicase